jgi:hypothetical protein
MPPAVGRSALNASSSEIFAPWAVTARSRTESIDRHPDPLTCGADQRKLFLVT